MATKVEVDYRQLQRDLKRLGDGIADGVAHVAADQAETTAAKIDSYTPVRTGLLASTVGSRMDASARYGTGAIVTYGGSPRLPYASYINNRNRPIKRGCRGARTDFYARLQALTAREVRRI